MQRVIHHFISLAKRYHKRILLPEVMDERVLLAANSIAAQGIADVVVLGKNEQEVHRYARKFGITLLSSVSIMSMEEHRHENAHLLYDLRSHKGMTMQQAQELVMQPMYAAVCLLRRGLVDGVIAGATHTTADTLRPALQVVKTQDGVALASSCFLMVLGNRLLVFADCALNINPTSQQLADIAEATVMTAQSLQMKPRVSFLSFSTKGSATHELVDKVREGWKLFAQKYPYVPSDGELQVDASLVEHVASKKAPDSPLHGDANVFIFPDLQSGNISYKLVERLAKATAVGPIVQGLRLPVNDLSRGCSVEDIVVVAAITALQAHHDEGHLHSDIEHKELLS